MTYVSPSLRLRPWLWCCSKGGNVVHSFEVCSVQSGVNAEQPRRTFSAGGRVKRAWSATW